MKTIKQNYIINSPIEKVWQAFIDPQKIENWGAGPAVMDDQVGTEFKLWGEDIWGKNLEVVKEEKLVQEWSDADLKNPSKVTFTFSKVDGGTEVSLLQEEVPEDRVADLSDGWKDYYLGALKTYLEKD